MNTLTKNTGWIWTARWASFLTYDEEFFNCGRDDYFQKAHELSNAGVNAVITFGGFHFHWNFISEWPRLLEMLRWTCEACHNYGIKVVEHHSANFVSAPIGEKEWADIKKRRGVELEKHSDFMQKLKAGDCIYKGIRFSSMFQIDPRTGQFARSPYSGWVLCHNNPDFHKLYFEHLQEIYACGIDGIMTDDIAFFPQGYGCGCLYCRNKFRKECGFELPPVGLDDRNFYGNFDNPAYRKWILWRIDCSKEHEIRLRTHYLNSGLDIARPIYSSSNTNSYGTWGFGFSIDNLDGLYSTVFTEVNDNDVQAHSFLRIAAESSQRNALARRNNIPPMCLFYPQNENENLFCWGITKLWGQNYWGTNLQTENSDDQYNEKIDSLFNFEQRYPDIYKKPVSLAEIGIVFSAKTVILHKDNDTELRGGMSDPASTDCWVGWCEVLTLANIPYDTLLEKDIEENKIPDRIKILIVPNIVCMSDKTISSIKQYVDSGGKLIITHQSGVKDETGCVREKYPFTDIVGAEYTGQIVKCAEWKNAGGANCLLNAPDITNDAFLSIFNLNKAELIYRTDDRNTKELYPVVFSNKLGKGKVITFACKPGRLVCINRHRRFEEAQKKYVEINFSMNKDIVTLMVETIKTLHQNQIFIASNIPEGIICGFFKTESATIIHLLNVSGVLRDNGKVLSMPPPVVFPEHSVEQEPYKIHIRNKFNAAQMFSPEYTGNIIFLNSYFSKEYTTIEIPPNLTQTYSVIKLI